jgi:hypothetical protein
VVFELENEFLADAIVDFVDYLAAIDRPDAVDLVPPELPDLHPKISLSASGR